MKQIFISHAGADSEIAKQLWIDLRNAGHEVRVDLNQLKLGDDVIDFMNEGIADADVNIVIFSHNTPSAKFQKLEINAAIWHETAQKGGKVIVLKADDAPLPPLLGCKVFGSLTTAEYKATLEKLCDAIIPATTDTALICEALKEGSTNPFWRVRAEYFEEEMPTLLASAFSPPDAAKVGILEEMKPCFLEGSRGTGKTMLLLSLRARILASRPSSTKSLEQIFGFYVRLDRGAFCNAGIQAANEGDFAAIEPRLLAQLTDTFAQEFYLTLLESLFSEVLFCVRDSELSMDATTESALVREVSSAVSSPKAAQPSNLDELLRRFAEMHRRLSDFIRRKFIYEEAATIPFASLDLVLFKHVIVLVKKALPALVNSQFTVLLDEYENLFPYQKIVVNSLIKLGPPHFSAKVGRKIGTDESSGTTVGQELQETHDYNRISLIYSVEDDADFARYLDLLEQMVKRLLENQKLPASGLSDILPGDDMEEVNPEQLRKAILTLAKLNQSEFDSLPPDQQKAKLTYYREAATYRLIYGRRGKRSEKRFAGHRQFAAAQD